MQEQVGRILVMRINTKPWLSSVHSCSKYKSFFFWVLEQRDALAQLQDQRALSIEWSNNCHSTSVRAPSAVSHHLIDRIIASISKAIWHGLFQSLYISFIFLLMPPYYIEYCTYIQRIQRRENFLLYCVLCICICHQSRI